MYDIIGDTHGHYDLLVKLLKKLGYEPSGSSYKHPERKVVFTGDFINRGPKIRQTVHLIRAMVENGDAFTILGNHELNAILYVTIDKSGKSLRKRLLRYKMPLLKTLEEYEKWPEEFTETVKWFRTLPIYLDFGGIRIVHGAWNDKCIETFNRYLNGEPKLKKSFLKTYLNSSELGNALNKLLKGEEMQLPKDLLVKDNNGVIRREFRIKWWEPVSGKTFNEAAFGNSFILPRYTLPPEIVPEISAYPSDAPPVFLGHYCLENEPFIYNTNICCIDNCITRSGMLASYRWNGEQKLSESNIVRV